VDSQEQIRGCNSQILTLQNTCEQN